MRVCWTNRSFKTVNSAMKPAVTRKIKFTYMYIHIRNGLKTCRIWIHATPVPINLKNRKRTSNKGVFEGYENEKKNKAIHTIDEYDRLLFFRVRCVPAGRHAHREKIERLVTSKYCIFTHCELVVHIPMNIIIIIIITDNHAGQRCFV